MRRVGFEAIIVLLTGACSLLAKDDFVIVGSGPDGGIDSALPIVEASTPEDAGPITDGSSLADVVVDSGKGFCGSFVSPPLICDDFDNRDALGNDEKLVLTSTGSLAIAMGNSISFPNALVALVPNGTMGRYPAAFKSYNVGSNISVIHLEFDLFIELQRNDAEGTFVTLEYQGASAITKIRVGIIANGSEALEQLSPPSSADVYPAVSKGVALPMNAWVHMVIDSNATAYKINVTANGSSLLTGNWPDARWTAGASKIDIGAFYPQEGSAPWKFRYDNVMATAN